MSRSGSHSGFFFKILQFRSENYYAISTAYESQAYEQRPGKKSFSVSGMSSHADCRRRPGVAEHRAGATESGRRHTGTDQQP